MKAFAALAIAGALFATTASAEPVMLAGGDTRVVIDISTDGENSFTLEDLGLQAGLTGTATLVDGAINFPITGGELDGIAGQILHEGSGVTLTGLDTEDGTGPTLFASNFIIDTINETLFGDVMVDGEVIGEDLDLFTFDAASVTAEALTDLDDPTLALFITETLAGALIDVFGADDFAGARFGFAATAPQVVPLPGALGLFLAGAGALGFIRRRRAA
ncbi:MAG: VPLPA-CTERM sorting domain-containing protein [Parvularculaceae bacterium]